MPVDLRALIADLWYVVWATFILISIIVYLTVDECVSLFNALRAPSEVDVESSVNVSECMESEVVQKKSNPIKSKCSSTKVENVNEVHQGPPRTQKLQKLAILKPEDNIAFYLDSQGVTHVEDDRSIKIMMLHRNDNSDSSSPTISARELFSVKPVIKNADIVSVSMTIPVPAEPSSLTKIRIVDENNNELETTTCSSGSLSNTLSVEEISQNTQSSSSENGKENGQQQSTKSAEYCVNSSNSNHQVSDCPDLSKSAVQPSSSDRLQGESLCSVSNTSTFDSASIDFAQSRNLLRPQPLWARYKTISMNSFML